MSAVPIDPGVRSPKRAQFRVVTVFFTVSIIVSGGSSGGEDMVSSSGPRLTLLLLILLPIFWRMPLAAIARELAAALLGNLALCFDYLASGARPLYAVSADGLFPKSDFRVSKRLGAPIAAILLMAVLNAVLIVGPFRNLVVIDVLIFISAVCLRVIEPDLQRRFRVPLGLAGMVALLSGPVPCCVFGAAYGGPGTPSREAGNEAPALAEAEAAEDAA